MVGIFKSLKWVLTGQVIRKSDVQIMNGNCVVSLRLKRESGDGRFYVVLAMTSSGNYQYFPLETDEFERFVDGAIDIRGDLQSAAGAKPGI